MLVVTNINEGIEPTTANHSNPNHFPLNHQITLSFCLKLLCASSIGFLLFLSTSVQIQTTIDCTFR